MTEQNSTPTIILVNSQMGENIGASARAMLNCGLVNLRLVSPKQGWPNDRAESMSVGALDAMPPVEVFNSVEEASHDINTLYATTARKRDMVKPVMTPQAAVSDMFTRTSQSEKVGVLFGGERAGLDNRDVSFADNLISIPLNPEFSSLNLSQAVLLISYEWSKLTFDAPDIELVMKESPTASGKEMTELYSRLETELQTHSFFRTPEMRPTMMNNIRSMLSRTQMSSQEAKTFHGIISALIGKKK